MSVDRNIFDSLSQGYAAIGNGRIIPGRSDYSPGAVGVVLPNKDSAEKFLEDNAETFSISGFDNLKIEPIESPWNFMRRAAGEGLCGLFIISGENDNILFIFLTRVEEAGNDLPTILAQLTSDGIKECLTRSGVRSFNHGDILHWERFDMMDAVTAKWGIHSPFPDWNIGDPMYELKSEGVALAIAEFPLMGNWINIEGGYPIFTDEDSAWHFLQHHVNSTNARLFIAKTRHIDPHDAITELSPHPIKDIQSRILELENDFPFTSICINPIGHRDNMAYVSSHGDLIHVSGLWAIRPNNQLEKKTNFQGWAHNDTIGWSGGPLIQLSPLHTSLSTPNQTMTEMEAQEWIAQHFREGHELEDLELDLKIHNQEEETIEQHPQIESFNDPELYFLSCWDTVTGDKGEEPIIVRHFLDILAWLAHFEFEDDRAYRTKGVQLSHGGEIGFPGSHNQDHENLTGERFRNGLKGILLRVLTNGYTPQDSNDLVFLCNATLKTLQVDFAGYGKDLLWACNDHESLAQILGVDGNAWNYSRLSMEALPDLKGQQIAIDRMGTESWLRLSNPVQQFVSTALVMMKEWGHIPQRDYAPISLELVKSLEVELSEILRQYRSQVSVEKDSDDGLAGQDKLLFDFVYNNNKPPTLGQIGFLLREPNSNSSKLSISFYNYIKSLPNGNFLLSSKFRRILSRTIHKYRNGGVHDSAISYDTCIEAIDVIIGTNGTDGVLARLLAR